jgi:hypothetical protein
MPSLREAGVPVCDWAGFLLTGNRRCFAQARG